MRSLKLRFPYQGQQVSAIDYLLLGLGVLALVVVFFQLKITMGKVAKWEMREAQLLKQQKQRVSPRTVSTRVTQVTQQEVKQAGDIISWLNLPWEPVFDSLEMAASKDVALLSLQPNAASHAIRISGESKNLQGVIEYVEALEREPVFKNVHLVNYRVRQDHPRRPVSFLIALTWSDSI
ncbi:MAG: PilN domain-containing protein [Nitrosomonas sp.]|nr:PilN domain-containing protein [Nitrosomonas sp.]